MLKENEKKTLHVLAYMMLRMGQEARAGRIYAALVALAPREHPDRLALAGVAAVADRAVEVVCGIPVWMKGEGPTR